MFKYWIVLCTAFSLALTGCSVFQGGQSGGFSRLPNGAIIDIESGPSGAVQQALLSQLDEWRGTPYQLGGSSKRGVDCSAFVQTTLAERFQMRVPRNTEQQVQAGFALDSSQIEPGDLVFFRTGRNSNHVGVYVGSRWFLHASTSVGVTLNSLDDPYWRRRYWTARRVF